MPAIYFSGWHIFWFFAKCPLSVFWLGCYSTVKISSSIILIKNIFLQFLQVSFGIYIYTSIHQYGYASIYIDIDIWRYKYIYINVYVHIHIYIYVFAYLYIFTYRFLFVFSSHLSSHSNIVWRTYYGKKPYSCMPIILSAPELAQRMLVTRWFFLVFKV